MLKKFNLIMLLVLCTTISFAQTWIDITDGYVVNPRFDNDDVTTGWQGTSFGTANPKENAEHYQKEYDSYQTITGLTPGQYRVSLNAFYRMGDANNDYYLYSNNQYQESLYAKLYATSSIGDFYVDIVPASSAALTNSLGGGTSMVGGGWWGGGTAYYIPNNMEAAYYWFEAGHYKNTVECEVGDDGELTIGIRKSNTLSGDWTCIDNWKLENYGYVTPVTELRFDEEKITMSLAETRQLPYSVIPSNATYQKVTWESTDEEVITVDQNGNVTAMGTGEAEIIITSTDGENISASIVVTVKSNDAIAGSLVVNEIMPANADMFIDPSWNYGGWIELYNPTDQSVTIANNYVSDDPANLKKCRIKLKVGSVPAHGYKNLWFGHDETRKDYGKGYVNTQMNFKLSTKGGTIYISDSQGNLILSQAYPPAKMRVSYARTTDGGEEWGYTATPTPELTNVGPLYYPVDDRLDDPVVDKDGQLFQGTLQVCVNIPQGCTLRYTTDGTTPTLTNGATSATGLFSVENTTCYRFRLFRDGFLPSNVVTRSYIYKDKDYYLPVVSVVTDPKNLYDNTIGVYVSGTNGKTANQDGTARNFNMDWDRPVSFEYITADNEFVVAQEMNYSISGGWSRKYTPRPFKLKAEKQFEINELTYPFFSDKPYIKNKAILMRNGGNDEYNQTRLKDAAIQEIARRSEFPLNLQSYNPAHVFYNGEYIAMLNMREVSNKQYAYANYGYDDDEVDAFEICVDSGYVQKAGTKDAFLQLYDLSANAADESTYEQIRQLLDIDDFINYMAFKLFLNDWDWPHNNFKAFRSRNDGRFHFMVFDLDNCVDRSGNNIFNDFENKKIHTFYQRPEYNWTSLTLEVEIVTIFLNLLENEQFKKQFIDTYCIVGGCVFRDADEIAEIVNNMASNIETALSWEGHTPWGTGRSFAQGIINALTGNLKSTMTNVMKNYGRFGLSNVERQAVRLSSSVDDGRILIDGIEVPKGKFDGYLFAPVTISAIAPAGYKFTGWRVKGDVETTAETVFDTGDTWTYYDQGSLEGTQWNTFNYSNSQFTQARAPFGYGKDGKPMSQATTILDKGSDASNVRPTYYLRKEFTLDNAPTENDVYKINYEVDDGMIVYINGYEAGLYHMQSGASYSNYTEDFNGAWYELDDPYHGSLVVDNSLLRKGRNVIAVELHNCIRTSSDLWFDCSLVHQTSASDEDFEIYTTEKAFDLPSGSDLDFIASYEPMSDKELKDAKITPLVINEISAANNIYINDYGKKNDWVEIYNTTSAPIDLEGMYLSDNEKKPLKYQITKGSSDASTIVPAHGFLLIWCDQLSPVTQLHASFKLAAEGGCVMLTASDESWTNRLDYPAHNGDNTVGRYPNGCDSVYVMAIPTIQKSNILDSYAEVAPQTEDDRLKGDVNEDGYVDINDVVAVINQMAGTASWRYADVNEDGDVDINDVVAIINIMAGGASLVNQVLSLLPADQQAKLINALAATGINEKFITSNNGLRISYGNSAVVVRSDNSSFVNLNIYTITGQDVLSTRLQMINGYAECSLSAIPNGTYVANAIDAEGNACSVKFIY